MVNSPRPAAASVEMELANRGAHANNSNNNNSGMYSSVATSGGDDDDEEEQALRGDGGHNKNGPALRRDPSVDRSSHQRWRVYAPLLLVSVSIVLALGAYRNRRELFPASILSTCGSGSAATDEDDGSTTPTKTSAQQQYTVTYDPSVTSNDWNPLDLNVQRDAALLSPTVLVDSNDEDSNEQQQQQPLGYAMQPDLVNGTLAFVSDGDLYWARLLVDSDDANDDDNAVTAAVRLTVTVGNVRTPKINPRYPHLIAYTATYQNRRDVYLLDLRRPHRAAQRLTYADSRYGVSSVAGWSRAGTAILYSTTNLQVGLRDARLYELALEQRQSPSQQPPNNSNHHMSVLETRPVPLSQAVDGVYYSGGGDGGDDSDSDCLVFVRFQQGSWTARYVGGTAESLWAYCSNSKGGDDDDDSNVAVPLTGDYRGTSRSPSVATYGGQRYLLFLSDRSGADPTAGPGVFQSGPKWRAATLNLFAAPLPTRAELLSHSGDGDSFVLTNVVQLTRASCQFGGRAVREYAADPVTGNVVLRIGADLHQLSADQIRHTLQNHNDSSAATPRPTPFAVAVVSDFHEQQERLIAVDLPKHLTAVDAFRTHFDTTAALLTVRGQLWVAPVSDDVDDDDNNSVAYQGAGQNLPPRRYRVIPGAMTGGAVRVLAARHVPLFDNSSDGNNKKRRLALVLATDPLSATAEHAFYLVEVQSDAVNAFAQLDHLPEPLVGGHLGGGSTAANGLGSVNAESVTVSPCGRRLAWTDTDDRICAVTLPLYVNGTKGATAGGDSNKNDRDDDGPPPPPYGYQCLPQHNDLGEPMAGTLAELSWSPGGRYLAVQHNALNQFSVLTIVDCGDPELTGQEEGGGGVADIDIGTIVQVTPSRFNSFSMLWGRTTFDIYLHQILVELTAELGLPAPPPSDKVAATTLYFVSDRDILSDVHSPWGSRAPLPHFESMEGNVYALPLPVKEPSSSSSAADASSSFDSTDHTLLGRFAGGGAMEVFADALDAYEETIKASSSSSPSSEASGERRQLRERLRSRLLKDLQGRRLQDDDRYSVARYLDAADTAAGATANPSNETEAASPFPQDADLDLPEQNELSLARKAYRLAHIPRGTYSIVSQTLDDGSLVIVDRDDESLKLFSAGAFPSDRLDVSSATGISSVGVSTSRHHLYAVSSVGRISVVSNTASGIAGLIGDSAWTSNQADTKGMAVSVWPALEYRQMYSDAWRMLRDYFYDPNLHNVDWKEVHERYLPLVQRCGKREELDDVLGQMGSELSALHLFVYGGEYNSPDEPPLAPASLGATLKRSPEWKGYMVAEIPQRDPDFNLIDGIARYCPLSDQALRPSGQKGLEVGDVIVAVNGESVMQGPDINMFLRGTAGRSIRLDVLRLQSQGGQQAKNETVETVPLVVVPITPAAADSLRYDAWEWKTRESAKKLASENGFSVGYIHMRAMDRAGEDAFARGFFPDYDKEALVIDVRHNNGGNIDSWILTFLQRKAWMYWGGRGFQRPGDLDYDEQFAFRGKVVVLIDEHTASNGEGVARGISELGIGKLVGKRTWGGGIWGSSANHLVDGGIVAAPQWGTFNEHFSWGGGVETTGVEPDIEVDNNPRTTYDGRDEQLERAIAELKALLKKEPVPPFPDPGKRPDMSLHADDCPR